MAIGGNYFVNSVNCTTRNENAIRHKRKYVQKSISEETKISENFIRWKFWTYWVLELNTCSLKTKTREVLLSHAENTKILIDKLRLRHKKHPETKT